MAKFIQSQESLDYKKRLKEFMSTVNPKPSVETLEKLKEQYMLARGKQHDQEYDQEPTHQ
jgi:hypothetical protein